MARRTTSTSKATSEAKASDTSKATSEAKASDTSKATSADEAKASDTSAEATSAEATSDTSADEASPSDTYRAVVAEAIANSDKATGTLPAISIDSLRRAMVAVKASERVALMLAVESEVTSAAREASPMDIGAILATVAIRGAVEELATSKVKALADPIADAANAYAALSLAARTIAHSIDEGDRDRFHSLADDSEASDAVATLAERLAKVATSTKGATASGADRADVIGSLASIASEASEGATFTVSELAKSIGCSTGSVQFALDNLSRVVAEAGALATMVDNGRGRMVKGMKRVATSEAIAAWEANEAEAKRYDEAMAKSMAKAHDAA